MPTRRRGHSGCDVAPRAERCDPSAAWNVVVVLEESLGSESIVRALPAHARAEHHAAFRFTHDGRERSSCTRTRPEIARSARSRRRRRRSAAPRALRSCAAISRRICSRCRTSFGRAATTRCSSTAGARCSMAWGATCATTAWSGSLSRATIRMGRSRPRGASPTKRSSIRPSPSSTRSTRRSDRSTRSCCP